MTLRTPRILTGAALAAVAALALAACSSGASPEATPEPSSSTPAATDAAFPVTLEHALGSVTIDEAPERIVTLGSREHELLYALGVAPVAVPVSWQGHEWGTGPWAEADRVAVGAEPETFEATTYDAEVIASFAPDLIVATYPTHEITQEEYDLLSGIAPVIVRGADYPEWGMPLDAELELIGAAVGRSDQAAVVIDEIDAAFAEVRDAHPEWAGLTATVGFYYDGNAGVYAPSDNRNQFLANLGLTVDAVEGAESAWLSISAEQLDVLSDLDAIVWQAATDPTTQDTLEALPLFDTLGVTERGGHVWIKEPILEGAFFANSPSSLRYALDAFVPGLEAALDGAVATQVPVFTDAG